MKCMCGTEASSAECGVCETNICSYCARMVIESGNVVIYHRSCWLLKEE